MIISKTPFRITLGGGGTDLPSYYKKHGGFIFAAGINKYMYIIVSTPFDDLIRLKYSRYEKVECAGQIEHNIARFVLSHMGINKKIDIVSLADLPAGSGLGSSSCYTVGLLNALHYRRGDDITPKYLAKEACYIEIEKMRLPCGKQDSYLGVFGGLTVLDISKTGAVKVRPANVTDSVKEELDRNLLLFHTNIIRDSRPILSEQARRIEDMSLTTTNIMSQIKELGYMMLESVESGDITQVGHIFDEHWELKRSISSLMSNSRINDLYAVAKAQGALGGKIIGAGGGGGLLFYVEEKHDAFIEKMKQQGLKHVDFNFEEGGTRRYSVV